MDAESTVVALTHPPAIPAGLTCDELKRELLRSYPTEGVRVRVGDKDYRVTSCRRWYEAGRGWFVSLSVREYSWEEELVQLQAVEG